MTTKAIAMSVNRVKSVIVFVILDVSETVHNQRETEYGQMAILILKASTTDPIFRRADLQREPHCAIQTIGSAVLTNCRDKDR